MMQQTNIMEQPVSEEVEGAPELPVCRHHWRIETPNGSTSAGKCKVCGEIREFSNSSSDSIWENDSSDSGSRWRGRGRNNTCRCRRAGAYERLSAADAPRIRSGAFLA